VVNEPENTGKERQRGKQKDQDAVAKRLRALGAGGGSVLVAHGAALGCSGGREGHQECDKTENQKHRGANCKVPRHMLAKSPNGATAVSSATKAEVQRLKPILLNAFMS